MGNITNTDVVEKILNSNSLIDINGDRFIVACSSVLLNKDDIDSLVKIIIKGKFVFNGTEFEIKRKISKSQLNKLIKEVNTGGIVNIVNYIDHDNILCERLNKINIDEWSLLEKVMVVNEIPSAIH